MAAGCVLIPTELLIDNGTALKITILQYADHWALSDTFKDWVNHANIFAIL